MDTKFLLKMSFILCLIGLFSLIFLAELIEPELKEIYDLKTNYKKYEGREIRIIGVASDIRKFSHGDISLKINDKNESIDITGSFIDLNIEINKTYEIIGNLQQYDSKLFIEATKINPI